MTWHEARDYCESLDAYLAEVPNTETQNILATHAATLSPANWWLGAKDKYIEGVWIWMRTGVEVRFTAWGVGEPNNMWGGEDCLYLQAKIGYLWDDERCKSGFQPLCQKF